MAKKAKTAKKIVPVFVAADLVELLALKHCEDIFVEECKNGPSLYGGGSHSRLDAWAMKRSWANPCMIGYEIKVSRADFMQDDKWHLYLPLCNQFYFVCPPQMIQPDELPPEVGLMWCSANSNRLYTKKKAPRREVEYPVDLFRYLLHNRTVVTRERWSFEDGDSKAKYWKRWLEKKDENSHIGRAVSGKIQRLYNKRVMEVESKQMILDAENRRLQKVATFLIELGVDINSFTPEDKIRSALGQKLPQIVDEAVRALRKSLSNLEQLHKDVEKELPTQKKDDDNVGS